MAYFGTQPNEVKKNTGLYTPSEILQLTKDGSWGGSLELIEEKSISGVSSAIFTSVSLKTGPAQLTSGGKYEAMALYYNAVERSGKRPTGIVREIQEGLKNLAPSTTAQVKGNLGSLIKSKKYEIVNKANALINSLN